ncbi:alpha-amylase [Caulobacter segnis]|uniref:Alpha amylase catalytic region n=2 Tax=Caulobacter segnis TaxID=88688 RepID=D5VLL1_CAUST|nr:alpha-amylase family glycosyl hydrolase [Caulobacter segnis]ADG11384.1 alpha amylase catalytic region [Caulobacter segnis ATCC 21756]AVQ03053.1 alpha-amylase [Caulobacter segnis]
MSVMTPWRRTLLAVLGSSALAAAAIAAPSSYPQRKPQDEVIYFLLPDRFENGDRGNDHGGPDRGPLVDGFDPTRAGFYHGGDLKGVTRRLDYIQGLGATAIWLAPIFKNKAVQGAPGRESAAHHGYWITDFTDVDPHFGTKADFKALVDAAHARGLKVYMDIVVNHTADVIQYRECPEGHCAYRGVADYPYARKGGVAGPTINEGFDGEDFGKLERPDWAYTPFVPAGQEAAKAPAWLNDPIYYHNRGESTFAGESSLLGDFATLDDVFTENPRVVAGFIEVYGRWIDDFGIDGFRIDTARHVNPEFWRAFVPAMLARAKAKGIPNFHIFGEVFDPDVAILASHTRVDKLPAVLDFAFQAAVTNVVTGKAGPERLARVFAGDPVYEGGEATARQLPTFLGNHDMGRIGWFVQKARPGIRDDELLARVTLANAVLLTARGVPTIYYGDEQGFTGDGDYADSREDMFPSRVASYNDNRLIGVSAKGARSAFDPDSALYRQIAELARIRAATPALRDGRQVTRVADQQPGLFAFSRLLAGTEVLAVFNTSDEPIKANVPVEARSASWRALRGACQSSAAAPDGYSVELAPLDYMLCVSEGRP